MQPILVTGAAGFIGFHVAKRLLDRGERVVGVDSLNDYYDPQLKRDRLAHLNVYDGFEFTQLDVADNRALVDVFDTTKPGAVIHLAAQAGVRYSIDNPNAYVQSNLVGFGNILEACRHREVRHLLFASSSSVYGANTRVPFSEHDTVDHPISLYAATKKANELMAHTYSHLFRLPTTGLRFFTVYGPWGRPDMAPFLFARAIRDGKPIKVFNHGAMRRDFTYVDDIAEGVLRTLDRIPQPMPSWSGDHPDPATSSAPYRIYNIGNSAPVDLLRFIELLEQNLGRCAEKVFLPLQPGDVVATYADTSALSRDTGFTPATPIEVGVARFAEWFNEYYR